MNIKPCIYYVQTLTATSTMLNHLKVLSSSTPKRAQFCWTILFFSRKEILNNLTSYGKKTSKLIDLRVFKIYEYLEFVVKIHITQSFMKKSVKCLMVDSRLLYFFNFRFRAYLMNIIIQVLPVKCDEVRITFKILLVIRYANYQEIVYFYI